MVNNPQRNGRKQNDFRVTNNWEEYPQCNRLTDEQFAQPQ